MSGRALLDSWHDDYVEVANCFAQADPKARVKWVGPDMSVRSSISARLMETWAHGQELYDLLGVKRINTDNIKSIAVLGVNTYAWSFKNRGLDLPGPAPCVRLAVPRGEVWEWNGPAGENVIQGSAVEFCQVVTQVRNIADTALSVSGDAAECWMAIAQCFAGAPQEPPPPATRFMQRGE